MSHRHFIIMITLACGLACAEVSAQLAWPVSVKFVYDANGTPPGNDPNCLDSGNGSAISCEAEVLDKIEYANQVLAKYKRGYRFKVVEILHWTKPPEPDILECVGGDDNEKFCIANGPKKCGNLECGADPSFCDDGKLQPSAFTDWATVPAGNSSVFLGCVARHDPDSNNDGLSDTYLWRQGALNTYIINLGGGGVCGPRRCHSADIPVTVIGQGSRGATVRPFHEYVHCLGLRHTHGSTNPMSCCHDSSKPFEEDAGACGDPGMVLGDDCMPDTLQDNQTCETLDLLVQSNFDAGNLSANTYDALPCQERQLVINTLYNVVSYHADDNHALPCDGTLPLLECDCDQPFPYGCPSTALDPNRCRHRLSSDQLDLVTDRSNAHAGDQLAMGCTHFVDATASIFGLVGISSCGNLSDVPRDGSSVHPYPTLALGLQAAGPGEIVLLRAASYNEPMTINQRVYLRASRGPALIGTSGP